METFHVRQASQSDAGHIAEFNRAMARETENRELIPNLIEAGVNSLMENPALGFYVVTESDDTVVACLMVTSEWSDWRNGLFWWIQSVYVSPDYRRRGIYRRMYQFVKELANENSQCVRISSLRRARECKRKIDVHFTRNGRDAVPALRRNQIRCQVFS